MTLPQLWLRQRRPWLFLLLSLAWAGLLSLVALTLLQPVGLAQTGPVGPASDTEPDAWATATPLLPPRYDLAAAVASTGDVYYVAGGIGEDGQPLDLFQGYDLANAAWITLTHLPEPLSQAAMVRAGRYIHVLGGRNADGRPVSRHDAYLLDSGLTSWQSLAPYPSQTAGLAAAAWGGKLYTVGGVDAEGTSSVAAWRYDMTTDKWQRLADLPQPAGRVGVTAADGYLFAVGGISGTVPLTMFVRYDPRYDVWFEGPPLPGGRVAPVVIAGGDYLYVLGGGGFAGSPDLPWPSGLRYDMTQFPAAGWEPADTSGLYPLMGAAGICASGRLWVVGGLDIDGRLHAYNHYFDLGGVPCQPNRQPLRLPLVHVREGRPQLKAGRWAGTTDHDDPLSFAFDDATHSLLAGTLSGQFYLANCLLGGSATVPYTEDQAVTVDPESWTFSTANPLRQITGTFTSPTTAQGRYRFVAVSVRGYNFCGGSGTWQATWQGP